MSSEKYRRSDLKQLAEDTSSVDVARALGMKVYRKGSRDFICCPGHEKRLGKKDSNPTNAVLTNRGYHCFACGASVSTADMIVEYTGWSLHRAFEFMAEVNGGAELYLDDGEVADQKTHIALSEDELQALGLDPMFTSKTPFSSVADSSPEIAKQIICERIKRRLPRYKAMQERYASEEGAWELYEYAKVTSEKRNNLLSEITRRIRTIKELESRLGLTAAAES